CAHAELAIQNDTGAVKIGKAPDDRKPQTGAGTGDIGISAAEAVEDMAVLFARDSNAAVRNAELYLLGVIEGERNSDVSTRRGESDRVGEEVGKDFLNRLKIAVQPGQI